MKYLLLRNSRGSALVLNLIALAVFSLLSVLVYRTVRFQVREAVYQERLAQAHYIAESGLEDALHSLYQDANWRTGFSQKAFAGGYYTVTLSTGTPPVITATGYSANIALFGRAVKTVSATAAISSSTGAATGAAYAIMADEMIEVNGPNGSVDAYDPSVSLTPASFTSTAVLWSNKDVKTTKDSSVRGNVFYFNNKSIYSGTVSGSVIKSTYTQTLPNHVCGTCSTANNNLTGITPSSCYNSGSRSLTAANGATCTMKAGVYFLHDITVNGTLNVTTTSGTATIYFDGAINTDGSCALNNLSKIPSRLLFYGEKAGGTHSFHCSAPLHAWLEEPTATFNIQSEVYGRVWGKTVKVTDSLHADIGPSSTPSGADWNPGTWGQSYERQ